MRINLIAAALISLTLAPVSRSLCQSSHAPERATRSEIERVTSCLHTGMLIAGEPQPCIRLNERMAELHVPGVSVAVIQNGRIRWAQGFGVRAIGLKAVAPDTLFQAASISKSVAALAALHEVQAGELSLDTDVNTELTSWKIPYSSFAHGKFVTLRELLGNTSGLGVGGFPGYPANSPVPSVLQILDGEKPSLTPAVRLEREPGTGFLYSGGGYTVMQQLLTDVTKIPFADLLEQTTLRPIGMVHSTFQQPLPRNLQSVAAVPYQGDGPPVAGGAHIHPEMAAAGLWTTPSDLARFAIDVQQSIAGKPGTVLSRSLAEELIKPVNERWSMGFQLAGPEDDPLLIHAGSNAGFECILLFYARHGDGAVIMTNSQGGSRLYLELAHSIAEEYQWPDFRLPVHTIVKVDPDVLKPYVGKYMLKDGTRFAIASDSDVLTIAFEGQSKGMTLYPESPTTFFFEGDGRIKFIPDAAGKVDSASLIADRQALAAKRQ